MLLEERYTIIKNKDVMDALTDTERAILENLIIKLNDYRANKGKHPLEGLFIRDTWPEYEPTLALLTKRVDEYEKHQQRPFEVGEMVYYVGNERRDIGNLYREYIGQVTFINRNGLIRVDDLRCFGDDVPEEFNPSDWKRIVTTSL